MSYKSAITITIVRDSDNGQEVTLKDVSIAFENLGYKCDLVIDKITGKQLIYIKDKYV